MAVLWEIYAEAGMPAGVYNIVLGYGAEAGAPLVEHEDVIGVSFTASPTTARDIARRAAKTLKRTSFELGSKSANIIFCRCRSEKGDTCSGDVYLHERGSSLCCGLAYSRAA